jgi:mRNA interferase HigB
MVVTGIERVEAFFKARKGHRGIVAARVQFEAWLVIASAAEWRTPEDVKRSHPRASILKGSRVVFNIRANDFRLVAIVRYQAGVLAIRFFGTHEEYDEIEAETV